jgi:hypothetical protein
MQRTGPYGPGKNAAGDEAQQEMMMRKIASALIALSVLAGAAMSVSAQTREDEASRDFWKWQEYQNPTP